LLIVSFFIDLLNTASANTFSLLIAIAGQVHVELSTLVTACDSTSFAMFESSEKVEWFLTQKTLRHVVDFDRPITDFESI
jgi:hypothetical protein